METFEKDKPFLLIAQAAKLLNVTPDRLRTYEEEGLIKPHRTIQNDQGKRLFSLSEIEWLINIRKLIKLGVSIPMLRIVLNSNIKMNKPLKYAKDKEILKLVEELKKHPVYKGIFS